MCKSVAGRGTSELRRLESLGKESAKPDKGISSGEAICSLGSGPAEFSQHLVSGSVTDVYSLLCRARSEVESN